MTSKDLFKLWAPSGARWVDWVRPLPFLDIGYTSHGICNFTPLNIHYISEAKMDTAIFIDLPGYDGIKEGIALAAIGYRPIPLYNGTNPQQGAMALVNNGIIKNALIWGALELKNISITEDAPPAFLLDSNRTHRFKMNASVFDNSWDLYAQDIPSAAYFLSNGINKIIIRSASVQKDLYKILYPFQKKGITVFYTNGYESPNVLVLKKPLSRFSFVEPGFAVGLLSDTWRKFYKCWMCGI